MILSVPTCPLFSCCRRIGANRTTDVGIVRFGVHSLARSMVGGPCLAPHDATIEPSSSRPVDSRRLSDTHHYHPYHEQIVMIALNIILI